MEEPRTPGSQYDGAQIEASHTNTGEYDTSQQPDPAIETADMQDSGGAGADVSGVEVPQAPLATGQTMDVHPANLTAAKDALAAQHAAERAVAEHGEDATINPEEFRSVALPPDAVATSGAEAQAPDEP